MNDNELRNDTQVKNTYRATSNLNTAIDNPQINMGNVVSVNIKDNDFNSSDSNLGNYSSNYENVSSFHSPNLGASDSFDYGNQMSQGGQFPFSMGSQDNLYNPQSQFENTFQMNQDANFHSDEGNGLFNNQSNFNSVSNELGSISQMTQGMNIDNSQFISNDMNSISSEQTADYVATGVNQGTYEPTMKEKKRPKESIKVPRELKVMLFIVFILFIFLLLMPYVYDFFKELQLVIMNS